jgi:hypothetical protein
VSAILMVKHALRPSKGLATPWMISISTIQNIINTVEVQTASKVTSITLTGTQKEMFYNALSQTMVLVVLADVSMTYLTSLRISVSMC